MLFKSGPIENVRKYILIGVLIEFEWNYLCMKKF